MFYPVVLWWKDVDRGKPKYSEESLSIAASSTTNLIRTDLGYLKMKINSLILKDSFGTAQLPPTPSVITRQAM